MKFTKLLVCLFFISSKVCAQNESIRFEIMNSDNAIVVIDSTFEYTYKVREDKPSQTKMATISKIYLGSDNGLQLIDSIIGGIHEVVSAYFHDSSYGLFKQTFSLLYKKTPTSFVFFLSANQLNNSQWVITRNSQYSRFSSYHDPQSRTKQIDSIEWFNSKMFKVYYQPEKILQKVERDPNSNEKIKTWKKLNDPKPPRVYAEIEGELIWLKNYDVRLRKKTNLLSKMVSKKEN